MKLIPKYRSKILILAHIMEFSLGRDIGGIEFAGLKSMRFHELKEPAIGSLVALSSAPSTKWYLSWLEDFKLYPGGYEYLLESIEDGELCYWSNVSLWQYSPEQVSFHPEWRWTDEQHKFNDRWFKTCAKLSNYLHVPMRADFINEKEVKLRIRKKFDSEGFKKEKVFDNWKNIKIRDMKDFYIQTIKET